jgi:hypothetical protein
MKVIDIELALPLKNSIKEKWMYKNSLRLFGLE